MLSRRDILKIGLAGSAYALAPSKFGTNPYLFADGGGLPPSPRTTPFVDPLPLPPAPQRVAPFTTRAEFQEFIDPAGLKTHFYQLVEEVRSVQLHSQLPPTSIWGYRDSNAASWPFVPGPTFHVNITEDPFGGNIVRHVNNLPTVANQRGFGLPRSTVHLHGGHHPAVSDGFPADIGLVNGVDFSNVTFESGGSFDYCYPMLSPGFRTTVDTSERPSTMWYHDHLLDFTGPNVYRGLAGFYLCFDDVDTGNENDSSSKALRLPSGNFDIPMVFQDKIIDANGQLQFDTFQHDGFLGDKFLVNGAIQPFFNVQRRKYRFRFLNGSNARIYQLFLTDNNGKSYPMTQIATEGGLLSRPVPRPNGVLLSMAERIEVVIDFSQFPAGTTALYFENRLNQTSGRGPGGDFNNPDLLSSGTRILKFNLLPGTVSDPSQVPQALRPFAPISASEISKAVVRNFQFDRSDGGWVINGQFVDLTRPLASASKAGVGEIWRLKNGGGGWWHPIHIHLEFGRVLKRNGRTPFGGGTGDHGQSLEQDGVAKKDTYLLGPGDQVDVFLRFRDFVGPYVFHCHNIEHEDMAMMARFDVAP